MSKTKPFPVRRRDESFSDATAWWIYVDRLRPRPDSVEDFVNGRAIGDAVDAHLAREHIDRVLERQGDDREAVRAALIRYIEQDRADRLAALAQRVEPYLRRKGRWLVGVPVLIDRHARTLSWVHGRDATDVAQKLTAGGWADAQFEPRTDM